MIDANDTSSGTSTKMNDRVTSVASSAGASVGATVGSVLGKALDARILMVSSDSDEEVVNPLSGAFDFPVASIVGTSLGAALGSSVASSLAKKTVGFMKATEKMSSNGLLPMTGTSRGKRRHPQTIPAITPATPPSNSSSPQRKGSPITCPSCGKSLSTFSSARKIAMKKTPKKSVRRVFPRVFPSRKHAIRKKSRKFRLTRAGHIHVATLLAVSGLCNIFMIGDKRCVSTMKQALFHPAQELMTGKMRRPVLAFGLKSRPRQWRKALSKVMIESMPFTHMYQHTPGS